MIILKSTHFLSVITFSRRRNEMSVEDLFNYCFGSNTNEQPVVVDTMAPIIEHVLEEEAILRENIDDNDDDTEFVVVDDDDEHNDGDDTEHNDDDIHISFPNNLDVTISHYSNGFFERVNSFPWTIVASFENDPISSLINSSMVYYKVLDKPCFDIVNNIHIESINKTCISIQPTTITESTCFMNDIISIIRIIDHSFIMISKCLDDSKWSVYCRSNNKWITDKTVIPTEYYDMINVWLRECYDKTCLSVTDNSLYNDNVKIMDYLNNLPTLTIPSPDKCNLYNTKWCGNVKWLAVLKHKKQFCIDKIKTLHIANGIQWDNIYQIINIAFKFEIGQGNACQREKILGERGMSV